MEIYLSKNLLHHRILTGDSQAKAATDLNLKRTTYVNYESGQNEPDLKTLVMISIKMGVSLDDLVLKDLSKGNLMTSFEEVEKRNLKRNLKGNLNDQKQQFLSNSNEPEVTYGSAGEKLRICEEKGALKDEIIEALKGQVEALKLATTRLS